MKHSIKTRFKYIAAFLAVILILLPLSGCLSDDNDDLSANNVENLFSSDIYITGYEGKKIGIISGSSYESYVKKYVTDCEIVEFDSTKEFFDSLVTGKVNAIVGDYNELKTNIKDYSNYKSIRDFEEFSNALFFPRNEKGEKLCAEMNEFISELSENGYLDTIYSVWFGDDELLKSKYYADTSYLTGENGTIKMAVASDIGCPFISYNGSTYGGYDVDIVVKFCQKYGYGLEFHDYSFKDLINAVATGECDLGGSGITITEERLKSVMFSNEIYHGTASFITFSDSEKLNSPYYDIMDVADIFAEKTIGVLTGSVFDATVKEFLPKSTVYYSNTTADLALALESNKISAYIADSPLANLLLKEYSNQYICSELADISFGFAFPKNDKKGARLHEEINEYITEISENGTLSEIHSVWFGDNEDLKIVDYLGLKNVNGEISVAVSTDVGAPFSYIRNGKIVGYDIDILTRFCREKGYSLKIYDYNFSGLIAAVSSGKCDIGASCICMTDERMEALDFSIPDYSGTISLVTKKLNPEEDTAEDIYEKLRGYRIGVVTGMIFDQVAEEKIPEAKVMYYNTNADLGLALDENKIDAYMLDEPISRVLTNEYPDQTILTIVSSESYGYIFPKNNEKGTELKLQINEFISYLKLSGEIKDIDNIWFGTDESKKVIDFSELPANPDINLKFAISTSMGEPFSYMKDGQYVGYDIDIVFRFCKKYGYGLTITDYDFNGLLGSVTSGIMDFGGSCITITEERKESVDFSNSVYDGGIVIVARNGDKNLSESDRSISSITDDLKERFEKTFIRESRWKLFVNGLLVTFNMVFFSAVIGTLLGFLLFLIYRRNIRIVNAIIDGASTIIKINPIVVILMILYYVVFANSNIDSIMVSCIGFIIIYTFVVLGLIKVAVGAVSSGQMEAALAMGYSDTHAFIRIILPQAMQHFYPGFRSSIVDLIKATAVVGYIAVQDLTKVSDIVRSRTYEAFFPLIASAVIYSFIAFVLIFFIKRIQFHTDPKNRSKEKILKGADKE